MKNTTITLELSHEDGTHLENFVQHLLSTYQFRVTRPVKKDMDTLQTLNNKLRAAL